MMVNILLINVYYDTKSDEDCNTVLGWSNRVEYTQANLYVRTEKMDSEALDALRSLIY